jgi:hypothetical protein
MSDAFREREKAFEEKWAHDQELRFKVLARRNRLLGLWAAGETGLTGAAVETYAQAIVQAEVVEVDDSKLLRKIQADFKAAKIVRTDHLIERKMDEYLAAAKEQVMKEG